MVLKSLPISCHFRGCKVPLFRIVTGAISSELALLWLYVFLCSYVISFVFYTLSFTVSFYNAKFLCAMNADVSLVKIKTEADSNEITDIAGCSHDKPSTGMFAVSDDIVSAVSCLCILCAVCCLRCFDCYCNHVITRCVAKIKVY